MVTDQTAREYNFSVQMTRLRTENAATANPHSLLLQKYAKFQDKMNQILIRWMKYYQPPETSKDENVRRYLPFIV